MGEADQLGAVAGRSPRMVWTKSFVRSLVGAADGTADSTRCPAPR